ncbi:MAG: hypothetical protein AVDCRST_MAG53-1404, partial [uncultured Solirubrobacteraceae bacterium]
EAEPRQAEPDPRPGRRCGGAERRRPGRARRVRRRRAGRALRLPRGRGTAAGARVVREQSGGHRGAGDRAPAEQLLRGELVQQGAGALRELHAERPDDLALRDSGERAILALAGLHPGAQLRHLRVLDRRTPDRRPLRRLRTGGGALAADRPGVVGAGRGVAHADAHRSRQEPRVVELLRRSGLLRAAHRGCHTRPAGRRGRTDRRSAGRARSAGAGPAGAQAAGPTRPPGPAPTGSRQPRDRPQAPVPLHAERPPRPPGRHPPGGRLPRLGDDPGQGREEHHLEPPHPGDAGVHVLPARQLRQLAPVRGPQAPQGRRPLRRQPLLAPRAREGHDGTRAL